MKSSKKSRHTAPGQYLGYAIQPVRLCFHLLNSPTGAFVSIEHMDDVAIHYSDGRQLLEQCKSALKQNPLSDWSTDLWKTIAIWIEMLSDSQIEQEKRDYCLYVTPIRSGTFAQALHNAQSLEDLQYITNEITQVLAKKKKPPACNGYLQSFLEASETDRLAVISRMKIESVHADPMEPLREFMRLWIEPELIDLVCSQIIGMAKEQADNLIREGKPALLSADDFKKQARSFLKTNNLPSLLRTFSTTPPFEQITSVLAAGPNFIKQLELVEVNEELRIRAVSDYLRTSADKTNWAEAGLIFPQQLNDWDDNLIRNYEFVREELFDTVGTSDSIQLGRQIFQRCGQYQAPLEGRAVPGHFVNGCYNTLADLLRIGWHPYYRTLLEKEGQ